MRRMRCGISTPAPVDVLFTDINLPGGVDGTALARRARELLPDLPVVYASGRVNMLDPQVRVPGSAFVPKPYVPGPDRAASRQCRQSDARNACRREALLLDRPAREKFLEPVDVIVAVDDLRFPHQRAKQRQRGLDAIDDEFVERAF